MPDELEILLVEDSPDDVALTMRALARHTHANRGHGARDGAEALDYLAERPRPRVVLLDLKLPKLSGLEVLERIKGDPATRTIPIVVLTSSREEPDIARAYELGVNSYIVKPVDFEQFVQAISEAGLYWLVLYEPPRRTPA
jgi:two-component system, response regulator